MKSMRPITAAVAERLKKQPKTSPKKKHLQTQCHLQILKKEKADCDIKKLNSSAFRRTTSIMWKWSNINDFSHLYACTMYSTNSRLTTISRSFYIGLHFSQSQVICNFCTILSGHLSCIRSILFRASKSHFTGRRPRYNLSFSIGNGHNNIVKR